MRTVLLIATKDLRQRTRDKSIFILGVAAPLALAVIFGFILNPISDAGFHADYVVVDLDGGQMAAEFRKVLDGLEEEGIATVREVDTTEEARAQVEAGSKTFAGDDEEAADVAFIIPEGFSDEILTGRPTKISLVVAKDSQLAGQVAYSITRGFAARLDAVRIAVEVALPDDEPPDPARLALLVQQAAAAEDPVVMEDVTATTKQLDQSTYMSVGMAVFFLFFTIALGVNGFLEERRLGTMDRLLAAPIGRRSIIFGKALVTFVLGVVSMMLLWMSTTLILDADWGDPLGVVILIVAVVISAMGILAVVAAFSKTPDQAMNLQAIIALVLAFLGGTFFSVAQAGGWLAELSMLTPHAWFMRGLGDLQGGELSAIWPSVFALLAFGFVTGALAWVFLVRRLER